MKKEDFTLSNIDTSKGFTDYWFDVHETTKEELTRKYMEQSMIEVSQCVYSPDDDQYGVMQLFPFNLSVIQPKDNELHDILKELVNDIINRKDENDE